MEYNENLSENEEMENEDEEQEGGTMKQWLQDNLRIIISVAIVVIIAAGIYSYSNRSIVPEATDQSDQTLSQDNTEAGEESTDQSAAVAKPATEEKTTPAPAAKTTPQNQTEKQASSVATSQETENSFVESASKGDGTTKLARRALANYLEKNPDSALTAEHKIYIEDFLRKNVTPKGKIAVGQSVEFSKDLIQKAINSSKNLNERQLQNLHKYAVRVPSLS
jgi:predicted negative regulator of RcsB-dependent stress response